MLEVTLQDATNIVAISGIVIGGNAALQKVMFGNRLDRILKLLAKHEHDDDGKVVAPIVNGDD